MKGDKRKLEQWWVTAPKDRFLAPELSVIHLVGIVDEWKGKTDHEIRTSYVVSVDGKEITTYSGSVYVLGEVAPHYKEWLDEHRPNWDPENPIKVLH